MLKTNKVCFRFVWSIIAIAILIPFSSLVHAHPFHLCVGQMKWNVESKVWEVSLRLHPQDLELAISKERFRDQPGKKISIDDEDFQEAAIEYLNRHFFLRSSPLAMNKEEFKAILHSQTKEKEREDSPVDQSTLKWVGKESEKGWLWIHFELTQPTVDLERQKIWFVHRLLVQSVERQENTIAIDPTVSKKFSLQFRLGEEFQELKPTVKTVSQLENGK